MGVFIKNFIILLFTIFAVSVNSSSLKVTRSIDISTQIARHTLNIEFKSDGNDKGFYHVLTKDENDHLSYITASDADSKKLTVLEVATPTGGKSDYVYYFIEFHTPSTKGTAYKIRLQYSLTQLYQAYPAEITQAENQFMLYTGTVNYVSHYDIEQDTTNIKVGNGKVLSYSSGKHSSDKIILGPTSQIKPYTFTPLKIHFENNSPFIIVTSLKRTVEVSHWGNIAIEDEVEIVHKGAALKGSFSRLDYQVDRRTRSPVVKSMKAVIPHGAQDIYYRDLIGNISTSVVRSFKDRVEVELKPRFPLFGGWKTNYVLGYNVPSSEFLFSSDNKYGLKLPFIHPLYTDMVVEKAEIHIILPETANNIKIVKPFTVTQLPDTLHYAYLDTVGRPVLNFEKTNIVEYHSQPFTIYYNFSYTNMLREPLIAVVAFFLIFLVVIIFNRFDFSISPKEAPHVKID